MHSSSPQPYRQQVAERKRKVLELRAFRLTYPDIARRLGLTVSQVSYCIRMAGFSYPAYVKQRHKARRGSPRKVIASRLKGMKRRAVDMTPPPSVDDFMGKIGPEPRCYLTGQPLDLTNSLNYEIDHVRPICEGGDNGLANLDIASTLANRMKNGLTLMRFVELCRTVAKHWEGKDLPPSAT